MAEVRAMYPERSILPGEVVMEDDPDTRHPGLAHCGSCMADADYDAENGTTYGPSGHPADPCCCNDLRREVGA